VEVEQDTLALMNICCNEKSHSVDVAGAIAVYNSGCSVDFLPRFSDADAETPGTFRSR
jgi:hypothetical protein